MFNPWNFEDTKPVTRRWTARLNINTYKKADNTRLVGTTQKLHDILEDSELLIHEDNIYIVSAHNELNLKTPKQSIFQPKSQFIDTSQVDEIRIEFGQLTSVRETISAQKKTFEWTTKTSANISKS